MSRAPRKPPLALDMDFAEALHRFGKTELSDLPDSVKLKKKKRTNKPAPNPSHD